MTIHVPSILPRSTLSPFALQYKFLQAGAHLPSLSGMGDSCPTQDEAGNWTDPCAGISPPTLNCPGDPGCPGYVPPLPDDLTSATSWANTGSAPYFDAGGDLVLPGSGTYVKISPSGSSTTYSGYPPAASSGTVSPSQAAMYASIISSLTTAGVRIAAITSLPAGASLLPNGTIVGAGQPIPGGSSFGSLFSNPMLLVGAAVIIAVVFAAEK